MAKENCPFAVRRPGSKALFCEKISGEKNYCGHQYFCPQTRRYEATKVAADCPLRKEKV